MNVLNKCGVVTRRKGVLNESTYMYVLNSRVCQTGFYPEIFDRAAQSARNITLTSYGGTLRALRVVRRKYDLIKA